MWKKIVAGIALILATPNPAAADWQYTKWGMTPDEVIAASNGAASESTPSPDSEPSEIVTLASADYVASGYEFWVSFGFSADRRLSEVSLSLRDSDKCVYLADALDRRYGRPVSREGGLLTVITWHEPDSGNSSELQVFGDDEIIWCHLVYKPLLGPDSGL